MNHWRASWQQGFHFTQDAEDFLTKWVGVCVWRRTLLLEVLFCLITSEIFTVNESVSVCEMAWLRRRIASLSTMRPISIPVHSVWDLWRRMWHWDTFFSRCSIFISSVPFDLCAKLIFHSHSYACLIYLSLSLSLAVCLRFIAYWLFSIRNNNNDCCRLYSISVTGLNPVIVFSFYHCFRNVTWYPITVVVKSQARSAAARAGAWMFVFLLLCAFANEKRLLLSSCPSVRVEQLGSH